MLNKPANFNLRLLAHMLDSTIFLSPNILFFYLITSSQYLNQFVSLIFLYLILYFLPSFLIPSLIQSYLTSKYGMTIGKLLTGLKVLHQSDNYLSFKQSYFRYTIGYAFSGLLFGLGFLAIIKDPQKQGWHDKAIGSKVIIKKNIWYQALIILITCYLFTGYIIWKGVNNYLNGPLPPQFLELFQNIQNHSLNEQNQIRDIPFKDQLKESTNSVQFN